MTHEIDELLQGATTSPGGVLDRRVVGVFVTLAAESWWSTREERLCERELRADMVAEFETNPGILDTDLATDDTASIRMTRRDGLDDQ
jgi:hypothetical protein